jgi:hypothetical protein
MHLKLILLYIFIYSAQLSSTINLPKRIINTSSDNKNNKKQKYNINFPYIYLFIKIFKLLFIK